VRRLAVTLYGVAHGLFVGDWGCLDEPGVASCLDGKTWVTTVAGLYNPQEHGSTCKVYSHLNSARDEHPITKGLGGFDAHQRGLHIGWRRTEVDGQIFDSWHMAGCSQRCISGQRSDDGVSVFANDWSDDQGRAFLREVRTLSCRRDVEDIRMVDLDTRLGAVDRVVRLSGDSHHSGVQVRLANEVCRHPWSTKFVMPETARPMRDDTFANVTWVCCHATVRGARVSVLHMSDPANPLREGLVYGTRQYGLFGASFPLELIPDAPVSLRFRIAWADRELTRDDCERLHREFSLPA